MTAKSIINIDVQDERFQEFLERFKDYQAAVSELPEEWRGIGVEIGNAAAQTGEAASESERMAQAFSDGIESIMALREATENLNASLQRNTAAQDDFNKQSLQSKNHLKSARGEAKGLSDHISSATKSLLTWSSIVGVLAGAGGMWGISALAETAQASRFGALGINSTSGAVDAANVNYQGALSNPEGTLTRISQIQNDASRRWIMGALGVKSTSSDPADALPEVIKNARDIYNRFDGQKQAADAYGLTDIFSTEELNRFRNMSDAEIDAMASRAAADKNALQLTDDQLRKWAELNRTLDRSQIGIRNTFIDALSPLAPEIGRISEGFESLIESFLKSPVVGEFLDDVAQGLHSLSSYLNTPEFKTDVSDFMASIRSMYQTVKRFTGGVDGIIDKFSWLFSDAPGNDAADLVEEKTGFDPRAIGEWFNEHTPQPVKDVLGYDLSFGMVSDAHADEVTPAFPNGEPINDRNINQAPDKIAPVIDSKSNNRDSAPDYDLREFNRSSEREISNYAVNRNAAEKSPVSGVKGWSTPGGAENPSSSAPQPLRDQVSQDFSYFADRIAAEGYKPLNSGRNEGGDNFSSMAAGNAPTKYDRYIEQSAKNNGVDANWLKAIIQAESSWNERAISRAGAKGLGQVMPKNFLPGEDPFNPRDNIEASARILKDAYNWSNKNAGGDTDEALRYYNGGRRRGSKENREYPERVREAYNSIYGAGQQVKQAVAGAENGSKDQLARETNNILRDLLREVQNQANISRSGGRSPGDNTNMNSKLLGGFS